MLHKLRNSNSLTSPGIGIFAFALIIRLIHLVQIRSAPFFELKMIDAKVYDAWARRIAGGDWIGTEVFFQAPMYPYFLGLIYATLGDETFVVRACQCLIGALSCVLLALAAGQLGSRNAGIVAGLMLAVYPPAIFFDSLIQKSVLDLFFVSLLLWLLSLQICRPKTAFWLAVGMVLGSLILTRENCIVFVPIILVWMLIHYRHRETKRWIDAAVFLAGLCAVLLPVAARNYVVGGEFHLTTSQFGVNFYVGNNETATGRFQALHYGHHEMDMWVEDFARRAEEAKGRPLTPGEVSRYYTQQTIAYIFSHPVRWTRLLTTKLLLIFNAAEAEDTEDIYTYSDASWPLRLAIPFLHFGVLMPVAVIGIWTSWPNRHRLWLFYVMMCGYAASVALFYVFARYRYPLAPFLILFASMGVVQFRHFFSQATRLQLAGCAATTCLAALLCNWPTDSKDEMRSATCVNVGNSLSEQGRYEEAIRQYTQAITYQSDFAGAHFNLALAYSNRADLDSARTHFMKALAIEPSLPESHFHLGLIAQRRRNLKEAIAQYQDALRLRPNYADAHNNLGLTLIFAGDEMAALDHFREAVRHRPEMAEAHTNLAMSLMRAGRSDLALEPLRAAVQLKPESPAALRKLAWLLATDPDPTLRQVDEAIRLASEAVSLTRRQDPAALDTLAAAYAANGRFGIAVETAQEGFQRAQTDGAQRLARAIRRRLTLYQKGQAYREVKTSARQNTGGVFDHSDRND